MAIPSFNSIRHRLGSRTAVVVAGAVGFAIGATGFVAAQDGQPEPAGADAGADVTLAVEGTVAMTVPETTAGTTPDSTLLSPTTIDPTIPTLPTESTIDDDTSTTAPDVTIDDTAPDVTVDDDTDDDSTSSTAPETTVDDTIDDDNATSSTTPHNTTDDTIPTRTLPGPFTETYTSAGGSVSVSWSGTAFSLNSISPAAGFVAEIEDNEWDRVRVDFEGDDDDFRIEVRLNDGAIRVRID